MAGRPRRLRPKDVCTTRMGGERPWHGYGDFVESLASDRAALGSLLNPRLPHESKQRIVAALLKDADPLVRNVMLVLVDNGRLELLHDVSVSYAELADSPDQREAALRFFRPRVGALAGSARGDTPHL